MNSMVTNFVNCGIEARNNTNKASCTYYFVN